MRGAILPAVLLTLTAQAVMGATPDSATSAAGLILEVQRLTASEAWVLTEQGLLATDDAGTTWSERTPEQGALGISDLDVIRGGHAWLAGVELQARDRLRVHVTHDGGRIWRQQSPAAGQLTGGDVYTRAYVSFSDRHHGWLLGKIARSAAFSDGVLLRTVDGGEHWHKLPAPPAAEDLVFIDETRGFLLAAGNQRLFATDDAGDTWWRVDLPLPDGAQAPLFSLPAFATAREGTLAVTNRGARPSLWLFGTHDGGATWRWLDTRSLADMEPANPVPVVAGEGRLDVVVDGDGIRVADSPTALSAEKAVGVEALVAGDNRVPSVRALFGGPAGDHWALLASGGCDGERCEQRVRLVALDNGTAPRILLHGLATHGRAAAVSPNGSVISNTYGFDRCDAPSTSQMSAWMNTSPFKDANIYYGGSERACYNQTYLNPAWVSTVFAQGWRLIPTWVGLQAPCYAGVSNKFSYDAATARNQGLAEADAAVNAAGTFGLAAGTPLYYDLENYNELDGACTTAVRAFVNGWVERVKAHGYIAGVYGNGFDAGHDWIPGVIANPPDAVWIANWVCTGGAVCNWTPTVYGLGGLSDSYWNNHQRIRQYWGDHNATYAGITLNIDSNFADGPVATPGGGGNCSASVPAQRWKGEYYPNRSLSGSPTLVRDDGAGNLNFNWGGGGPNSCGIGSDNFSARWTRTIYLSSGTWRFTTTTDDGVRLWVDGVLRIDRWIDQAPTTYHADVNLGAGNHTVRMEFYENGGGATAQLSWQNVGNQTQTVLCDDGNGCFYRFGPSGYWHRETQCGGSSVGYAGDLYWTYVNGNVISNFVRWYPNINGAGNFHMWVWIPRCYGTTVQARYRIYHNGVSNYVTVNQNNMYDQWVYLGAFYFAGGGSEYLELTDATGEAANSYRQISFDAAYWSRQ